MTQLAFSTLRHANLARLPEFKNAQGQPAHEQPDGSDWTLLEWAGAAAGEVGEAANVAKKIRRGDYADEREGVRAMGDEIADAVIYLDILAARAGLDLGTIVVEKWNRTSEKIGYSGRLFG